LKIGKITPQIEMEMVRISTKLSRFLDSLTFCVQAMLPCVAPAARQYCLHAVMGWL
jgi:hypothetical protein